MTNKNMNWNNKAFLLAPTGKDYLWGGELLNTVFHKDIAMAPLAETWECSAHPDGPCTIASGEFAGMSLPCLLEMHPEYLGRHPTSTMQDSQQGAGTLPILIKLIDASRDLSVQVHPDDRYAKLHENGSLGKTEMWYVLDAEPDAHLIYGFNRDMDKNLLCKSLEQGTIDKYLQKIPVCKNDMFYIEAGTVHAIGAGVLLAEIQESSNLTYRLFDYGRRDKSGHLRPLHIEKALQVINYKSSEAPRQPIRVLRYRPGYASELLCRCKYFQVERLLINTSADQFLDCSTTTTSFHVLLCIDGEGELYTETKSSIPSANHHRETLPFTKGNCIFIPADSAPTKISGRATLLQVSC